MSIKTIQTERLWQETYEAWLEADFGMLNRKGRQVWYHWPAGGEYTEANSINALAAKLTDRALRDRA